MEWSQVNIPRGVLLPTFAGNFQAYSRDLTFALTQEIQQLWARAETLDTDSNIADGVIGTLYIADAAVTNAKIVTCSIDKLTAGTITSQAITLAVTADAGDVKIQAGKTDFGDTTAGFILGIDDSDSDRAKFEFGDATYSIKWTGTALQVTGDIIATSNVQAGAITTLGFAQDGGGNLTVDPAEVEVIDITITATNMPVTIHFSCMVAGVGGNTFGDWKLWRGPMTTGTLLDTFDSAFQNGLGSVFNNFIYQDTTPGSGSVEYTVSFENGGLNIATATEVNILVTENKK